MRVDRLLLFEGPREVAVIEDCHCEIKLAQCIRVPGLRTYFSETPYETVIDVGGCSQSRGSPGVSVCVWGEGGINNRQKNMRKTCLSEHEAASKIPND